MILEAVLESDTISIRRVNRRDAIMTGGRYCVRGRKKIGSIGTLAGTDTANLPRANRIACPRSVGHSVADRFIRNSRVGYHARHRVTRLSGQRFFPWQELRGTKKMICRGYLFFFIYI